MTNQRDRAIDALLARATPPAAGASGECLDAETAAAWFDGTLRADERAVAEAHAGACARCQALLATMARIEPASQAGRWWERLPLRWLVPATATAAAVAIWVAVVPHDQPIAPPPSASSTVAPADTRAANAQDKKVEETRKAFEPPAAPRPAAPPAPATVAPEGALADRRERQAPPVQSPESSATRPDAAHPETKTRRKMQSPPVTDSTAGLSNAAALRSALAAAVVVKSPDSASQWRVGDPGVIEHSGDGGATWVPQQTGAPVVLTAGASPARDVVWFVGSGGVVLLSTDGRTWQRLTVGQAVDLVGVRPTDDKTATVIAANGREFTTHDGGSTWSPARLQELPAAPF